MDVIFLYMADIFSNFASFYESVRIAVDSIRANTTRSLLTILGIVVGVAVVVMVAALLQGAQNVITKAIADFAPDVVRLEKASFQDFNADGQAFAEARSKRPDILSDDLEFLRSRLDSNFVVGAQTDASLPAKRGTKTLVGIAVQGVTSNITELTNLKIERGRYFRDIDIEFRRNVCVIGQDVVDELFGGTNPIGQKIQLGQLAYEVIGVAESKGSLFGNSQDGFVQIPLGTFEKVFGKRSRSIAILIKAEDTKNIKPEETADRVRVAMRIRRGLVLTDKEDNFSLVTADSIQAFSGNLTGIVGAIIYPLTMIALFVGGVVVMNMMLASVAERTKEIGIRMALGARRINILMQFLVETTVLTLIGGVIGLLTAAALIGIIVWLTEFPLTLPVWAVFLAIGVSCAVGIVFGVIPARQASKLDPIEALNSD
jgi:putative ABC transport system permease protein